MVGALCPASCCFLSQGPRVACLWFSRFLSFREKMSKRILLAQLGPVICLPSTTGFLTVLSHVDPPPAFIRRLLWRRVWSVETCQEPSVTWREIMGEKNLESRLEPKPQMPPKMFKRYSHVENIVVAQNLLWENSPVLSR